MEKWIANLKLGNKECHEVMVISEPFTFKYGTDSFILVKFQKGKMKGKVIDAPVHHLKFVEWVI